jgi:hypothetical protein
MCIVQQADPRFVIGLNGGIAGLAVLEDLGVVNAPNRNIEPIGSGQVDVAVSQHHVSGEKIDVLLGKRAESTVAGYDPDPVIDPALAKQTLAKAQN